MFDKAFRGMIQVLLCRNHQWQMGTVRVQSSDIRPTRDRAMIGHSEALAFVAKFPRRVHGFGYYTTPPHLGTLRRPWTSPDNRGACSGFESMQPMRARRNLG